MTKSNYGIGTVFLVPLAGGGAARGVVARASRGAKILFGYFFGPSIGSKATVSLSDLTSGTAIFSARFGDLGLHEGRWTVVGVIPNWKSSEWPMQSAVRRDPLGKARPILVKFDENDPSRIVAESPFEGPDSLPTDALAGYRFVEAKLSKLIQ